jgi:hypothetical protein
LTATNVEYRPVVGFPAYRVGDDGSVWSCYLAGTRGRTGDSWKRLATRRHSHGYPMVSLCREGKRRLRYVHHLVLEAFVGPCPVGLECLHGDDNPSNNQLGNLRWGTHSENLFDRTRNGNARCAFGADHRLAKLKEADIPVIFRMREQGATQQQIADRFGIRAQTVACALRRETWKHVAI